MIYWAINDVFLFAVKRKLHNVLPKKNLFSTGRGNSNVVHSGLLDFDERVSFSKDSIQFVPRK